MSFLSIKMAEDLAMPDRKRKPERETPHKDKICKMCGRTFVWRKEWAQDWGVMKYCSDACRGHQPGEAEAALEAIYSVAQITPPAESDEVFRGHPLAAPTTRASILFYLVWPGLFLASGVLARRRLK